MLTSFNKPGKMQLACSGRVVSSEGERFLDAEEVAGSSPAPPTKWLKEAAKRRFFFFNLSVNTQFEIFIQLQFLNFGFIIHNI